VTDAARAAVHRLSARVLLFDDAGRVLLVEGSNPIRPDAGRWWFPIGGGVEDGEDLHGAATRELREEAGIHHIEFGPLVWMRSADFPYQEGMHLYQREHYFVGRTHESVIRTDGWTDYERRQGLVLRWWCLDDLVATTDAIVPSQLRQLIGAIGAGHYPAAPIELEPLHVDD
jgi:8-oxo-dGTP pyrophosphatase MutT (NUDIX family)